MCIRDSDCNHTSDYDADQDGFESAEYDGDDCDDANSGAYPGAEEIWYDGIDQNCDGESDFDRDRDGFDLEDDCDDTESRLYPNAPGYDENCDPIAVKDSEANAAGGCACSATPGTGQLKGGIAWMVGLLGFVAMRRRRK